MEYRPLDITIISAEDLKNVNMICKMDVYVIVSISGDLKNKRKTHVDKDGGTNPRWNHRIKFSIEEPSLATLSLLFQIKSNRSFGDKDIGEVSIPVVELLDTAANDNSERVVDYQVRTPLGKPKGTLKFSYKFGEKFIAQLEAKTPKGGDKAKNVDGHVTAYPAPVGTSTAYMPPPGVGYAMPPPGMVAPYPPPPEYGYPPPGYGYPPPGYGYPPAGPGYGYPPPPMAGYGYPMVQQPQQQTQKKKKKNNSKLGLGLGAGLLGGLLVGDMISDVGEMASYDAGYSAGMDDAGFDF